MRKILFLGFIVCQFLQASFSFAALREYNLVIAEQQVRIENKTTRGMTINGTIPGPTLSFQKGDIARIHVTNTMSVATTIHWHGILVPPLMDGVPMVSQPAIAPGQTFTYEFPIRQTGTYWYHSHSALQEQRGLYGSIVIADDQPSERDYVLLLSDWTTDSPGAVLRTLKRGSEWYSLEKGSSQSILGAAKAGRLGQYFKRELQRMPPMDISDVAYDYFLSNGEPVHHLKAKKGEIVRVRVINGSATTYFHLRYAGGPMTIISADGQLVEPVDKDLFLIGVAETYDILVPIPGNGAYELRATAHDGSGFTTTWLGSGKRHLTASVAKPDLYAPMQHGGMNTLFALTPAGVMGVPDDLVNSGMFDKPGMLHTGQSMGANMAEGMSSKNMKHTMGSMGSAQKKEGMAMGDVPETGNAGNKVRIKRHDGMPDMADATPKKASQDIPVLKPAREYGRKFGLLEADIGSRKNLAVEGGTERPFPPYSDLRSRVKTTPPDNAPRRVIRLTLDGDMERYTWFLNNKPLSEADNILIREGEVVRFIMINRTMMHHPMHLHGHFFRVVNGQGDYSPLKHTVNVAPMATTVIEFFSNERGDWFFHCHLLYHMKSGMARVVHYDDFSPSSQVSAIRQQLNEDPYSFFGRADIESNMTEGSLRLANTRLEFMANWEVGWQGVEGTDWESQLTADYHYNRFTSLFLGADVLGIDSSSEDFRGVAGLRYLLPLNIRSSFWLDSDGGARLMMEKEFELTPRLGLHGEVEYDTHDEWEGKVGLSYLVSRELSLLFNYHSEYGLGAGLQLRF